jgi:hypothetical protein
MENILMILGILACALAITTLIYIGAHPHEIQSYLDSIGWISTFGEWLGSLPEFLRIFIGMSMILFFIAYLFRSASKYYR